ncbi:MAG: hypothetical protein OCU18_07160 [Candidatus Syntrophoarchaeum sp.]|nr:hypothetical protein [Candidatus Syntrophoarchaeum sp.]
MISERKIECELMLRKNISLTDEHIKMLEPFIKEHEGNISAAIRSVVELSCKKPIPSSPETAGVAQLHIPLVKWLISNSRGCVPDSGVLREIMCDLGFNLRMPSIDEVCDGLWRMVNNAGFPVQAEVITKNERSIVAKFKGSDPIFNEFIAMVISCTFASLDPQYRIKEADNPSTLIKISYERDDGAYERIIEHFGYNQSSCDELKSRWDWWKWVIETTAMLNYRMIFLSESVLEGLLQGKDCPGGITYLERRSGKYYKEIPFDEVFPLLKEEFKNARLVEDMSLRADGNEILVYHNFTDPMVMASIAKWIEELIKVYWDKVECETSALTTVFRRID